MTRVVDEALRICRAMMPGLPGGTCSVRDDDETTSYAGDGGAALIASRGIYRRCPEVHGIVHWYPMNLLTLAATGQALRPVMLTGAFLPEGGIPVLSVSEPLASEAAATALAEALSDRPLCITPQYGVFASGSSLEEAVTIVLGAEKNAVQQVAAGIVGSPNFFQGGEYRALFSEQQGYAAHGVRKYWSYLVESTR